MRDSFRVQALVTYAVCPSAVTASPHASAGSATRPSSRIDGPALTTTSSPGSRTVTSSRSPSDTTCAGAPGSASDDSVAVTAMGSSVGGGFSSRMLFGMRAASAPSATALSSGVRTTRRSRR